MCTREDLIRRIWPPDPFVDYERGLNVAVAGLRQALGDAAEAPRYVETVGRKGYRFVAPVGRLSGPERIDLPTALEPAKPKPSQLWPSVAIGAIVLAAAAIAGWWRATR